MNFEADPRRASLLAVVSLFIIGRADVARGGRNILRGTPTNRIVNALIILHPHLSEQLHCRNMAEPLRCCWIKQGIKQLSSLPSDIFGESLTLGFPQRRTRIFEACAIAVHPLSLPVIPQPVWSNHPETVERTAHRFPDAQHAVEGRDLGQDLGRIGARSAR